METLSTEKTKELFSFGQGDEKKLIDFLSQNKQGQIVDLETIIEGGQKLDKVKERLGGRSKIFLPGSDTLENFSGFKI